MSSEDRQRGGQAPGPYRYDWSLFADWCMAYELSSLPAHPVTVARFLDAHPAAPSTHRRRLTAINAAHLAAGHRLPGRLQAIREYLRPAGVGVRIDPAAVAYRVAELPTSGWTAGMFGRRDALLLVLAGIAGLPFAAIERLQRSDAQLTGTELHIEVGGHLVVLDATPEDPMTCPVAVYLRWARLLAYYDSRPSTSALARALRSATPLTEDSVERYRALPALRPGRDGALLPGVDQWGHLAPPKGPRGARRGLSANAIAAIVDAHLAGTAPDRRSVPESPLSAPQSHDAAPVNPATPEPVGVGAEAADSALAVVDPAAGIALRRTATAELNDLGPMFADIDARAAELLARTEALLESLNLPD